ncbi:MAG: cytochrome d ubiquinol oxidase subunit II [Geminicoccaceae bacterium]
MDAQSLAYFWAAMIAFSIVVYVVLDGFDLGVGILFGLTPDEDHRAPMMHAIAPFWDGNETWLILIAASLFAAFPAVYAIFLSAFYLPALLLLIGLIFRGVAFEFRERSAGMRPVWDTGFWLGSAVVAFVQGAAIGAMIKELPVVDSRFAGDSWSWLSPFAVLCGFGLVCGYALLGAGWLVHKTDGRVREWAYRRIPWLVLGTLLFMVAAFLVTLDTHLRVADRWAERHWLWLFPILGALAIGGILAGVRLRRDELPFRATVALFLIAFASLAGSFWPWMIPYSVTVLDAAAPLQSLTFLFYGAGLVVFPVVLAYTIGVYAIFRGKLHDGYD